MQNIWKEWVVTHVKMLFLNLPGEAEDNHGNLSENNLRASLHSMQSFPE
jgi:hypothetical protein